MRIDPNKCAAVFIDYQEKLVPVLDNNETVINNTSTLFEGLKLLNIPTLAAAQYKKGLGDTVPALRELEGYPEAIDKITFSCGLNEDFISVLKSTGAKHLIVCGVESHICLLQSVIDFIELGYSVYLVEDCCTSRTHQNHITGMKRCEQEGAFITCVESILFELLRAAGSDTFKAISKLIK